MIGIASGPGSSLCWLLHTPASFASVNPALNSAIAFFELAVFLSSWTRLRRFILLFFFNSLLLFFLLSHLSISSPLVVCCYLLQAYPGCLVGSAHNALSLFQPAQRFCFA